MNKYLSLIAVLMLGACADAVVENGAVYPGSEDPSGLLNVDDGDNIYGNAVVIFEVEKTLKDNDTVTAIVRAQDGENFYACVLAAFDDTPTATKTMGDPFTGVHAFIFAYNGASTDGSSTTDLYPDDLAGFSGTHTMRCVVEEDEPRSCLTKSGEKVMGGTYDIIKMYVDGELLQTYTLGDCGDDESPISYGKFGFGGYDTDGDSSHRILTYKLLAAEPVPSCKYDTCAVTATR